MVFKLTYTGVGTHFRFEHTHLISKMSERLLSRAKGLLDFMMGRKDKTARIKAVYLGND